MTMIMISMIMMNMIMMVIIITTTQKMGPRSGGCGHSGKWLWVPEWSNVNILQSIFILDKTLPSSTNHHHYQQTIANCIKPLSSSTNHRHHRQTIVITNKSSSSLTDHHNYRQTIVIIEAIFIINWMTFDSLEKKVIFYWSPCQGPRSWAKTEALTHNLYGENLGPG